MSNRSLEDFQHSIGMLLRGWSEPIEFTTRTSGLDVRKTVHRKYASLLSQLAENASQPMQAGARGPSGPNKAGSRPPTNSQYSDCIDGIQEQATEALIELHVAFRPYGKQSVEWLLSNLEFEVTHRYLAQQAECFRAAETVDRMVRKARVLLGYETRLIILADTSCHQCHGTLTVAADASTDVVCLDCGHSYSRMKWIDLL